MTGSGASLGEAVLDLTADPTKLKSDMSAAQGMVKGQMSTMAKTIASTGKQGFAELGANVAAFGTKAALGFAAAFTAVGVGAIKMAIDAAPLQTVQASFDGLATAAGSGMDEMLAALQKGSSGMIANRDLMMSFNKASQLISKDFAVQLPDAMKYLGKISASTGDDMGYLMNSLVVGVGRLSPMILDNLQIQVTLEQATARAAEMYGKEADALSKTELQAGMMDLALTKLAENTKDIPDVAGSAQAEIVGLGVTFTNLKDEIGMKLIPVILPFIKYISELAKKYLPMFTEKLGNVLEKVGWVVEAFLDAGPGSLEFKEALSTLFGGDMVANIMNFFTQIGNVFTSIGDFVTKTLVPFVVKYGPQLKTFFMTLGAILAAAGIVSAIASIGAVIASLFSPIGLIVGIIALLAAAWAGNWGGIRTVLTDFWYNTALPILTELWTWLGPVISQAITALANFWQNVLLPAIQTVWNFILTKVFPLYATLFEWLATVIPPAIQTLSDFWNNVLLPAFDAVWAFIDQNILPVLGLLGELIGVILVAYGEALGALWNNVLLPAFTAVWAFIQDKVIPILQKLGEWIDVNLMPILETIADFLLAGLEKGFTAVSKAIQWVIDKVKTLIDWFRQLRGAAPKEYMPGSLPPLAQGFADISEQMKGVRQQAGAMMGTLEGLSAFGGVALQTGFSLNPTYAPQPYSGPPGEAQMNPFGTNVEIHIHGDVGSQGDIDLLAQKVVSYINLRRRK